MTEPTPTSRELDRRAWRYAARRSWHGFRRHRGVDAAAALTFFAALSLFPASLAVVSAFAVFDSRSNAADELLALAGEFVQESTVQALADPLDQLLSIDQPILAMFIGLGLTLWTVSAYATAFGRAMNAVYEMQEGRPIWRFRGLMLLVTVVLMVGFSLIMTMLVVTPRAARAIAATAGFGEPWLTVWNGGKWLPIAVIAFLLVSVLYYFTPNVRHTRMRWVSYGSAFAVTVWALGTAGFAVYILTVGRYERVYGWIGGGIVALLWLYLTNLVLVLGAEVDAELVRARQLLAGIPAEEGIRLPARDLTRARSLARQRSLDEQDGRALRDDAVSRD
ncbi:MULTISPECIES: YihY/virulence factor BrkB family protein [unclassified Diaminobutyricimonas]|uniref:YihY/virulence factor BrkB family protein n=1 Tax=unclassified Diaminobutyricimonas TaxID=2643261 RepID=UPI0012F4E795|nr:MULTISPECIES: YihY/virulence factor BrkB family protein [unclassified Diaminobutyricimonas]